MAQEEPVKVRGVKRKRKWGTLTTTEEEFLEELQEGLASLGMVSMSEEDLKTLRDRRLQRKLEEMQARPLR